MRNRTYGGVRGRKTKVGEKLLRFPPTRLNATHEQGNWTPLLKEKHYICTMKELLETIPRIELALIIIGVFALMLGILFGYVMIHEYRMYLEDHWKARFSFRDFLKQEQFYIILLLVSIFIMSLNLLYFLE